MNIPKMVEWGTISEKDLDMFIVTDSVEEAFDYLVGEIEALSTGGWRIIVVLVYARN